MADSSSHLQLRELILAQLDGTISPEQYGTLQRLLNEDPDARRYYTEYVMLCAAIRRHINPSAAMNQKKQNLDLGSDPLWQDLANEEKSAQAVKTQLPASDVSSIPIQTTSGKKAILRIRRRSLVTFILSTAALVFVVLLARYLPAPANIEVATLSASIKSQWDISSDVKEKGDRLVTGYAPLTLQEGIIQLQFDNTAKVIIEGPAQFALLTEDQVKLNYGRLYAVVPHKAIGFTVNTPNSRIIDMGTEFGVQAESSSATELHVIKGRINLLAGTTNKTAMEVRQGYAKKVSGDDSLVNDIPVKETLFVRSINSGNNMIWRGQKQIDLADVIGGGNGFGTGRTDAWLDLADGKNGTKLILNPDRQQFSKEELSKIERRLTDNRYHAVSHLPYIDGVFSPDGQTGAVYVSSEGHAWKDCPDTSGVYFEDIFNGSNVNTSYNHRLILNNQLYGTKEFPAIALHSNAGITFNLKAIRQDMPGLKIVRFTAVCGVSKESGRTGNKEDFWVLVDGQKRFEAIGLEYNSGPREISIPLSSLDQYLTLVSTDGDLYPYNDWGFFGMPRLEIEDTQ